MNENKSTKNRTDNPKANPDPITKAPGAHPVGTGVGAAGGAAAGAAIGSIGGPIGAGIGIAAGAVAGGLAGKGVAEHFDPTEEDAYWKEHYNSEPYYQAGTSFEDYQPAYRFGYNAYSRYGASGKHWEDVESDLQRDYEREHGSSRLSWSQAEPAVRAAWGRLHDHAHPDYERLIGYEVIDRNDNKVGTVNHLWTDHTGQPAFLGIKTGWVFGKTHVVPVSSAEVNNFNEVIRLPFTEEQIKGAVSYDPDAELDSATEAEIYRYFNVETPSSTAYATEHLTDQELGSRNMAGTREAETREETRIPLHEEQVTVGKREVEAGGIRLRKIIRTEVVNQPVELKREEIVIERVPSQGQVTDEGSFEEREIFVPLRREEPVIAKQSRVREEVRVGKKVTTERQNVSEKVRKEDVEVDQNQGTNRAQRVHDPEYDKP